MDDNKKDHYTKILDEAQQREDFYKQIVQELRTEERYRNYFSQFSPASVDRFVNYYATQKVSWYRYSGVHASWEKRKNERWYTLARNFIVAMQRIKVIQTIIRWGNYELTVPEARSYFDFQKWVSNPFICPYIQPVQAHEVDTAIRFIGTLGEERLKYLEIRHFIIQSLLLLGNPEHEADEYNYSYFHRYWDKEYGMEHLRAKVPERLRKEEEYVDAYRDFQKQQQPAEEPTPAGQKLSLPFWEINVTEKFITACETPEYKRMYKAHRWWQNRNEFSEFAERELDDLSGSPQNLPIESADDWREALEHTAEAYARQQVTECLPLVYNEYLERLEKKNSFAGWVKDENDHTKHPWYEKYLADLLEGRKLMNEPADFNF